MAVRIPSAGAGVVRSSPSRKGSIIEESRPLQLFLENIPAMRKAMPACAAQAFAFSPLNALPKIALEKWHVREFPGALALVSADGVHRVCPTGSREEYFDAIITLLQGRASLALVPAWLAGRLRAHFKVAKQHEEYVVRTVDVQTFPGGRNRQMRGNVNKARRLCDVELYSREQHLAEYKALVRTWYRQNATLKFRTYDKTSIDWLLENWPALVQELPDLACLGVRHGVQLIAMNMGCRLSEEYWTAYTQRFDRNAPVKHANMLGYNALAGSFPGLELENDGTADTKTIREWKNRLAQHTVTFFTVSP